MVSCNFSELFLKAPTSVTSWNISACNYLFQCISPASVLAPGEQEGPFALRHNPYFRNGPWRLTPEFSTMQQLAKLTFKAYAGREYFGHWTVLPDGSFAREFRSSPIGRDMRRRGSYDCWCWPAETVRNLRSGRLCLGACDRCVFLVWVCDCVTFRHVGV
jgi:hypothetical protein